MRPENPYFKVIEEHFSLDESVQYERYGNCYSQGFDAAIKYLTEPCTDHYVLLPKDRPFKNWIHTQHRYLCPQCVAELEEQGK